MQINYVGDILAALNVRVDLTHSLINMAMLKGINSILNRVMNNITVKQLFNSYL